MEQIGSFFWDSIVAFVLIFVLGLWYDTKKLDYFKKRGIKYVQPLPFVGNFWSVVMGRNSMMSAAQPLYEKLKSSKLGGVFIMRNPMIMVCDPELAKMVLTKDFSSNHDRGFPYDEKNDPMSANLVNIPGARWKNLRSKLNPTFSSGKLKQMFPLMKECSNNLSKILSEKADNGETLDLKEYLVRYCTDVIGTCAFGIECNSLVNANSEFYEMSRKVFQPSVLGSIRVALFANSKILVKLLPFKWLFPGVHRFFIDLMKETVHYRKTNSVERNDFVQLMMQLQKGDEAKTPENHPDEVLFTDNIMAAQAFVFFIAGLDSIANTVGFALHHMCLDTRIQEDLADEVISVLRNHEGQFTYEALKDMKMVDRVISEALRMYTPGGLLFRAVTSPKYIIPGTNITLEKGIRIMIPVQGFHYDPDIYPEPKKFNPDRFTEEEVAKRHPYAYMPFGEGPRVCIANRFALLESKLCLASLIKDFKFSVCPQTQIPLELETRSFSPTPKGGFYFKIEKRSL